MPKNPNRRPTQQPFTFTTSPPLPSLAALTHSKEIMTKYYRFMLTSFGNQNECCFCPSCNDWFVEVDTKEKDSTLWRKIDCEACKHEFCGACGMEPHIQRPGGLNLTCSEFALSKKSAGTDGAAENEALFNKFIQDQTDTVFCPNPKCKNPLVLIEGSCKFTICRCNTRLCFICGSLCSDGDHYRHFTGPGLQGPFGNTCKGPNDPDITKPANARRMAIPVKKPAPKRRKKKI